MSNFDNTVQSESQIIEDEDDMALFDVPQKSTSKPSELNNCSKVEENSNPEDQSTKKSESNEQNPSQIIEEENTPIVDLSECVEDVSYFVLLSYFIIYIKVKLHIKYIAAIHNRF